MHLRSLQTLLPWSIRYSRDFRANPQPHKDFAHALTHILKAAGRLAELVDNMDHNREVADSSKLRDEYEKFVAYMVVCALRMANTFPGGGLDLEMAVIRRIETKNGVTLTSDCPQPSEREERMNSVLQKTARECPNGCDRRWLRFTNHVQGPTRVWCAVCGRQGPEGETLEQAQELWDHDFT